MVLTWSWWALPNVIGIVALGAMAVWIYAANPRRLQNRLVAIMLWSGGVLFNAGFRVLPMLVDDADAARAWAVASYVLIILWGTTYLAVMATLNSKISRWLRRPWFWAPMGIYTVTMMVLAVALPDRLAPSVVPAVIGPGFVPEMGVLRAINLYVAQVILILGITVSIDQYVGAAPGAAKQTAKHYMIAFVGGDGLFLLTNATFLVLQNNADPVAASTINHLGTAVGTIWLGLALAYAVLHSQLFDFQLKLKGGVDKGTVALAFLAVFFVTATVASEFLVDRYGVLVGGVAAGLLLFALAPLQRFGERVGDLVMPSIQDSDDYKLVRKREVYEVAVAGMTQDGHISDKEMDVLSRLADDLGLTVQETRAIERRLLPS